MPSTEKVIICEQHIALQTLHTDSSLTCKNVARVLETVKVYQLEFYLYIPYDIKGKVREHCAHDGEKQRRNQLVHYWISVSPYASWSWLAGQLHLNKEESALAAAKIYVQRAPGMHGCGKCECRGYL